MGGLAVVGSAILTTIGYFWFSALWGLITNGSSVGVMVVGALLFVFTLFYFVGAEIALIAAWFA